MNPPPPKPTACRLLHRERRDVSPRACLLLAWEPDTRDAALALWSDLGAVAVKDPRAASSAPSLKGVWFEYGPDARGEVWGRLRGRRCDPAGQVEWELSNEDWLGCLEADDELSLLVALEEPDVGLARAFRAEGDTAKRHWLQVNGICLEDSPLGEAP